MFATLGSLPMVANSLESRYGSLPLVANSFEETRWIENPSPLGSEFFGVGGMDYFEEEMVGYLR